jgi:hypothetical protein
MGNHPSLLLFLIQLKNGIYRTSEFEGSCLLEILTFEKKAAPVNPVQLT